MSFSPDPTLLQQSIALLVGSQVPGADQAAVQRVRSGTRALLCAVLWLRSPLCVRAQSLDEANKNPQFTVYLLYILVNGGAHSLPVELRQVREWP